MFKLSTFLHGEIKKNNKSYSIFPNPNPTGLFHLTTSQRWSVYSDAGILLKQGEGEQVDLTGHPKELYVLKIGEVTHFLMKMI